MIDYFKILMLFVFFTSTFFFFYVKIDVILFFSQKSKLFACIFYGIKVCLMIFDIQMYHFLYLKT